MPGENSFLVYVAGPYSGDVGVNVRRAIKAGVALRDAGAAVIIPHLSHLTHLIEPRDYEYWMSWDLDILCRCDLMVRLSGDSPGADREEERAKELAIPVVHGLESGLECVAEWCKENDA